MSQQEQNDKSQYFYRASAADFMKIPGNPVVYWFTDVSRSSFLKQKIGEVATFRAGLQTGNNDLFLRYWFEVDTIKFKADCDTREAASNSGCKWFPHNKGGGYRKWYGNKEYVINWFDDGHDIKEKKKNDLDAGIITRNNSKCWNQDFYFKAGLTWSALSSSDFSLRDNGVGSLFDTKGQMLFPENAVLGAKILTFLNSKVAKYFLSALAPTLDFNGGVISTLPIADIEDSLELTNELVRLSKTDWDSAETSWDFSGLHILLTENLGNTIEKSYSNSISQWKNIIQTMKNIEERFNLSYLKSFGLESEVDPVLSDDEITLICNPYYRYGNDRDKEEYSTLLKCDTLKELICYNIGCMMGRYSIDKPGLILASQGETQQDFLNQIPNSRFMPDNDAILPLTDQEWFADDVTNRVREFVKVVWGEDTLQENLAFIAESLCLHAIKGKKGESSIETIRRYLSTQFYKDHLKTYKKRPIYWLFSSGKEKAFECLVYLHRYNESTLARMRTEYVTPLMGKYDAQQSLLQEQLNDASPAQQRELEKQLKDLAKKQTELRAFDENLKHYADMRIKLDLDDGVKVNYGKFGNLLAEVKNITGDKE